MFAISKIKKSLVAYYKSRQFNPDLFSLFYMPNWIIRRRLYMHVSAKKDFMSGTLMDLGCGDKPYIDLFEVDQYIGVDVLQSGHRSCDMKADIYYDGVKLPFDDNSIDSVFCSEVLEHVFNLDLLLKEVSRVLKPNGYFLLTIPFAWGEHEVPYDFARYTSFGIKSVLSNNHFKIESIEKTSNFFETILQLLCVYISSCILPKNAFLRLILCPLFVTPFLVIGMFLSKILPDKDRMYLNLVVVAKRI